MKKELRLTGGENNCSGRVEVKIHERWGTVCRNGWSMNQVSVVCRQLGCPTYIQALGWANSSAGSGDIWMDKVSCTGNESALWDCKHEGWGKHNCTHEQDVGVTCSGKADLRHSKCHTRLPDSTDSVHLPGKMGQLILAQPFTDAEIPCKVFNLSKHLMTP